jgi:hypothetical protein
MFGVDMEIIPCGLGASITDLRLHLAPSSGQGSCLTFQIWANKYGYTSMMTVPYPHPQHMKVAKGFVVVSIMDV